MSNLSTELAAARALHSQGAYDAANAAYTKLAQAHPNNVELMHLRGVLAFQQDRIAEALPLLHRAVLASPGRYHYHSNFALALSEDGQHEFALNEMEAAVALKPDSPALLTDLGNLHRTVGHFAEARNFLAEAAARDPGDHHAQSNYLYGLLFDGAADDKTVGAAHAEWGKRMVASVPAQPLPAREWDPERTLRVGFVSTDFKRHAVALFAEPLLEGLDRRQFHLIAYSSLRRPDEFTQRLKGLFAEWRDVVQNTDEELAGLIARDGVDILIDLNGHTADNRLRAFARRPAPVQLSYLGYPNGTGLPTIDFRISDAWADPPESDHPYDPIWRLDRCAWCFRADPFIPGHRGAADSVHFGSFNQYGKISPRTIELWAAVLAAVPGSRLLIKARSLSDALARYNLMDYFLKRRADISRIETLPWATSREEHLRQYHQVDIALDTYPYQGTTTTCEALSMGVPVVTLAGTRHSARVGPSLLHACGLDAWIARDDAGFVRIAQEQARNVAALRQGRLALRQRLEASPLMSVADMGQAFGGALRAIWRQACAREATGR